MIYIMSGEVIGGIRAGGGVEILETLLAVCVGRGGGGGGIIRQSRVPRKVSRFIFTVVVFYYDIMTSLV